MIGEVSGINTEHAIFSSFCSCKFYQFVYNYYVWMSPSDIIYSSHAIYMCILFFLQTPCCNKIYTCRFCHDENESHCVNRKDVTELVCTNCDTRQKVQAECENCSLRFGKVSLILCTVCCLL
jgi:hypothetical protein